MFEKERGYSTLVFFVYIVSWITFWIALWGWIADKEMPFVGVLLGLLTGYNLALKRTRNSDETVRTSVDGVTLMLYGAFLLTCLLYITRFIKKVF